MNVARKRNFSQHSFMSVLLIFGYHLLLYINWDKIHWIFLCFLAKNTILCSKSQLLQRFIFSYSEIFYEKFIKKLKKGVFASSKAPRKKIEHFLEVLGNFGNKSAMKSDRWGDLGRYISKISEKSLFLGEKYTHHFCTAQRSSLELG